MEKDIHYYRQQFIIESKELIDQICDDILRAEKDPENELLLNSIFRNVHTIKGSAGSFGYDQLGSFTHHLENLLSEIRNKNIILTGEIADIVLQYCDKINNVIDDYEINNDIQIDYDIIAKVNDILESYALRRNDTARQSREKQESNNKNSNIENIIQNNIEKIEKRKNINENINENIKAERNEEGGSITKIIDIENIKIDNIKIEEYLVRNDYNNNVIDFLMKNDEEKNEDLIKLLTQDKLNEIKKYRKENNIYFIKVKYNNQLHQNGYDQAILLNQIYEISDYYSVSSGLTNIPLLYEFDCETLYLSPLIVIASKFSKNEIEELAFDVDLLKVISLNQSIDDCLIKLENDINNGESKQKNSNKANKANNAILDNNKKLSIISNKLDINDGSDKNEDKIPNAPHKENQNEEYAEDIDLELLGEFLISFEEMSEALENAVINYEENHAIESLNTIFRIVHTLKGDAGYVGLHKFSKKAHELENYLDKLRQGGIKDNHKNTDYILRGVDILKNEIKKLNFRIIKNNHLLTKTISITKGKEFDSLTEDKIYSEISSLPIVDLDFINKNPEVKETFLDQLSQYRDFLDVAGKSKIELNSLKRIVRVLKSLAKSSSFIGLRTLSSLAESSCRNFSENKFRNEQENKAKDSIFEIIAFIDGLTNEPMRLGEILINEQKISKEDLHEALAKQKQVGQILIDSGKIKSEDLEKALRKQKIMDVAKQLKTDSSGKKTENFATMRVDERKIEIFANLVGEMIVARNAYDFIISEIAKYDWHENTQFIKKLKDNHHEINRLSNEMQLGVMALRMVPIKGIFQKFRRVVRDIARKQRKSIDLVTKGEDTDIDKSVADQLSDPLIHLIRNACDHGIETVEQRLKDGKSEQGTLCLSASQEGSNVIIRIEDDGKGLDKDKILEKAKNMGIQHEEKLSEADIYALIFLPGLSTAETVSDVSGRGVGMDVVMSTIKQLGGDIKIQSNLGLGTKIILSIPMSMGIAECLLVVDYKQDYAIPLENVLEVIKVSPNTIHEIQNCMAIYYRGEIIPIEKLSNLLEGKNSLERNSDKMDQIALNNEVINIDMIKNKIANTEDIPLVVLRNSYGNFGVIIENLGKNMELSIKSLPDQLNGINVISGVSIMGDGRVVLVLNVEELA